jgi:chromosome segregation ATPase
MSRRIAAILLVGGLGVGGWGLGTDGCGPLASLGGGLTAAGLSAQTPQPDYEASRRRLEDIRAERDRLRREQQQLESQVRDAGAELRNIERQREVTNRLVNELERQMRGLGDQLLNSSQELALAQDNLLDRRAVLERRLIDIY